MMRKEAFLNDYSSRCPIGVSICLSVSLGWGNALLADRCPNFLESLAFSSSSFQTWTFRFLNILHTSCLATTGTTHPVTRLLARKYVALWPFSSKNQHENIHRCLQTDLRNVTHCISCSCSNRKCIILFYWFSEYCNNVQAGPKVGIQ